MLILGINFTNHREGVESIWTVVADEQRDKSDDRSDQSFYLQDGNLSPYVFYTHDELLEVKKDIVRVVNRIGYDGEEFNEEMEHTKECARQIREKIKEGYKPEFVIYELKPVSMGTAAFNIRSDCLF
jgi:hypothetical protein